MIMDSPQFPETTVDEIADGIYRISTPVPPEMMPGGFSFNQYLVVDEKPLLYHTGPRKIFSQVRNAIGRVMPVSKLAYIGFSHVEADECGTLNDFLELAPDAVPLCGQVAKMVSVDDIALRPARAMADGEVLDLGRHRIRWFATPHLPHGWECSMAFEETTRTLLCGDLFTQPGHANPPLTEGDILESSEVFRLQMDYYAHSPDTAHHLKRLAEVQPETLACMHGSAWRGDGAKLLGRLSERLTAR
ncbi:MAG TPA: MBL fold metallo-hydrolase [Noviherbaspirillum sp.]|nr:MBL fold metallo-hydrolase [Noviherbaspirillum sp.]HZW23169.1 MBL fold metallo-hydrolase [Noviherbaspirillum sp.]